MTQPSETKTEPGIRLEFTLRQHHAVFFTVAEFAEWAATVIPGVNPEDLDEVYNALDRGGYEIEGYLEELRSAHSWFETDDAQIRDVERETVDSPAVSA